MGSDQAYGIAPDKMMEIQRMKGFTIKFIKKFDKDWAEVVLAAQKLKGKQRGRNGKAMGKVK